MPTHPPAPRAPTEPPLVKILVRRVNRVRASWEDRASPLRSPSVDELFDEFFILWRALEATFDRDGSHRARAVIAITQAIALEGVFPLIDLLAFGKSLRHLQDADGKVLSGWFSEGEFTPLEADEMRAQLAQVVRSSEMPTQWHRGRDSRALANILYGIRCAVFHSSLDTSNTVAIKILPALGRGMVDLILARAAGLLNTRVHGARGLFDDDLKEWQ